MNANNALDVLTSLFTSLAGEEIYLAFADSAETSYAIPSLDEAARFIEKHKARGVFVSTGTFQPGTARKQAYLLSVPVIALDADLTSCLTAEGVDPDEADQRVSTCDEKTLKRLCEKHISLILSELARIGLAPSAIVFTGRGHHVYLSLDFLDQREIEQICGIHRRIVSSVNKHVGFDLFDKLVVDSGTRYVRVPGTANLKCEPVRYAAIVQNSGPSYSLQQLEEAVGVDPTAEQEPEHPQTDANDIETITAMLLPYWRRGGRHDLALSLAGYLAKGG